MLNFVEESDLMPVLAVTKVLEVTTDYGRFTSITRYASSLLLERLAKAGKIRVEPTGEKTMLRVRSTV